MDFSLRARARPAARAADLIGMMGKVTGFLEIDRRDAKYQPASDRIRHFREFTFSMAETDARAGGALHGLRHPPLPRAERLPGAQPDPRLGTTSSTSRISWELALENLHLFGYS